MYYRKRAGGRFVERGDYELTIPDQITDSPDSSYVALVSCQKESQHERVFVSHLDDREWRGLIKAGVSIDMNVVVREKVDVAGLESMHNWEQARHRCPNCSYDNWKPPTGPRRTPRSRSTGAIQGVKWYCIHRSRIPGKNDPIC